MEREIIQIDEDKCTGCGECIPNCHEGALQMIDGKARLISDLMCDGLGACIGHCPEDAIEIIKREAQPYDEIAVIKEMVIKGRNTVIAHLKHLKDHMEFGFLKQGLKWIQENKENIDFDVDEVISVVHNGLVEEKEAIASACACGNDEDHHHTSQKPHNHEHGHSGGGCLGTLSQSIDKPQNINTENMQDVASQLTHWPVQMHLINPSASHFRNSDLVLAADCVAFSMGDFHQKHLKGKTLTIACPKLDSNKDVYVQKLISLIDDAKVNTITVMKMTVPCCGGILQMAQIASQQASRKVPIKSITVDINGKIHHEDWV